MSAVSDSGRRQESPFVLPPSTSLRFPLLIVSVVASSIFVYTIIYTITPLGAAGTAIERVCDVRAALSQGLEGTSPSGGDPPPTVAACRSEAEHLAGLWVLGGIGVLILLAGILYSAQPWWYRRRKHLVPLTGAEADGLVSHLERLRGRAAIGPVVWLLQPSNSRMSAFAFGSFRRRHVAVSGGAAVISVREPATFDAVILHELAHFKNRDVAQTYLAMAIWRAFLVAAIVPLAALLVSGQHAVSVPRVAWRVTLLALTVYLLRNSVLRSREFDADARVQGLDPDTALGAVLAGLPRRRRRFWHFGGSHPSGRERAMALLNPEPLYHSGFWDGLALGLITSVGAAATQTLIFTFNIASFNGILLSDVMFALFGGPAVAVAMWRKQLLAPETLTPRGWTVGWGLGIGLAIGPIIELSAVLDPGLAPDTLRPGAVSVLAVWVILIALVFVSLPVWAGYWADAWQQRRGGASLRVPARGGLLAASAAAFVVLAVGLWFLISYADLIKIFDSTTKQTLTRDWTSTGLIFAQQPSVWVVCCIFVTVPASGLIASRRWPRWRDAGDRALLLQRARRIALLCAAGALTEVALAVAVDATAHARIAQPIRWSGYFAARLAMWDDQAAVAIAVVFALIAAAAIKSAPAVPAALLVAATVSAAGTPVALNLSPIGSCLGPLSVEYNRPPASQCLHLVGGLFTVQQTMGGAVEAVLLGIFLVPAAHYTGVVLTRYHADRSAVRARARAFRWFAVSVAFAAVIAGTAWQLSGVSARGIRTSGSIGQDGWISGPGYRMRLYPSWYERAATGDQVTLVSPVAQSQVIIQYISDHGTTLPGNTDTGKVYPVVIGGVEGLGSGPFRVSHQIEERWLVVRTSHNYALTLTTSAAYGVLPQHGMAVMLDSWQWETAQLYAGACGCPRRQGFSGSGRAGTTSIAKGGRWMKFRSGLVALAIIIGGMTSCAPAATESTASCIDRMATWDNNGGLQRFDAAIGSNAPKVVKADRLLIAALKSGTGLTAAESDLQSVAAAIRSDDAAAEADLPPTCIPHLRADEEKSLIEYGQTAPDYENAVTEISDKNYSSAAKDLAAATTTAKAANTDLKAANKDIYTFVKS